MTPFLLFGFGIWTLSLAVPHTGTNVVGWMSIVGGAVCILSLVFMVKKLNVTVSLFKVNSTHCAFLNFSSYSVGNVGADGPHRYFLGGHCDVGRLLGVFGSVDLPVWLALPPWQCRHRPDDGIGVLVSGPDLVYRLDVLRLDVPLDDRDCQQHPSLHDLWCYMPVVLSSVCTCFVTAFLKKK